MGMKLVSEENVSNAIGAALGLVSNLRKLRSGETFTPSAEDLWSVFAERIEGGESLENILGEIEIAIILALISRGDKGRRTSAELALILNKSHDATRMLLSSRGIKLTEISPRN